MFLKIGLIIVSNRANLSLSGIDILNELRFFCEIFFWTAPVTILVIFLCLKNKYNHSVDTFLPCRTWAWLLSQYYPLSTKTKESALNTASMAINPNTSTSSHLASKMLIMSCTACCSNRSTTDHFIAFSVFCFRLSLICKG